jgi:hypothetical protein
VPPHGGDITSFVAPDVPPVTDPPQDNKVAPAQSSFAGGLTTHVVKVVLVGSADAE